MAGVRTACKSIGKHENETPESDGDNENVVEGSKGFVNVENTAVEEEDTKFDAAVCKLFNYQNRTVRLWIFFLGLADHSRGQRDRVLVYLS